MIDHATERIWGKKENSNEAIRDLIRTGSLHALLLESRSVIVCKRPAYKWDWKCQSWHIANQNYSTVLKHNLANIHYQQNYSSVGLSYTFPHLNSVINLHKQHSKRKTVLTKHFFELLLQILWCCIYRICYLTAIMMQYSVRKAQCSRLNRQSHCTTLRKCKDE